MHIITNADLRSVSAGPCGETQHVDQSTKAQAVEDFIVFHPSSHLHITAAKLRLELADTSQERQRAVGAAMELGMPLWQIEQYLDWLDFSRSCESSLKKSHSWVEELRARLAIQFRAGVELVRRTHRRLFGSADPA